MLTAMLLTLLMGLSAFAVDVGNWYYVGEKAQRAADAAALSGVTSLPGSPASAYSTAQAFSATNGFTNGTNATVSTAVVSGRPTRLQVTVTRTVNNIFGALLGVPTKTISRTAVADYAGPVPMGSPCNEYGDDPEGDGRRSGNCSASGAFWANIGSPYGTKVSGDAYQDNVCSGEDGCTGSVNNDYDPNGYVYLVTVRAPINGLTIQAFDPAQVVVGDYCDSGNLDGAKDLATSDVPVSNPSTRYDKGAGSWCTGDQPLNSTDGVFTTRFNVFSPGSNPWNPLGWPQVATKDFKGYNGTLTDRLSNKKPDYDKDGVATNFRRWVNLYSTTGTIGPGTYAIQATTNLAGNATKGGHNRFGLRAFGASSGDKDKISVAGFTKMGMYGNTPNGTSKFYLAKVPSGAHGQLFNIRLYDIGDGAKAGSTIKVLPPSETGGGFSGCKGSGVQNGALTDCTISVNSSYNGKWQTISVPIPVDYSCTDSSPTGCWVRLEFYYGSGSTPADTTSWTASIEGDPVRLVE